MELRPYQQQAKDAIFSEWENGIKKTLLVLPTGCGKTIVFAKVAEECVKGGSRVLILAHRGELLDQAADKIGKSTGLGCATEKAEQTCLGSWFRIVVGSVQSMMREKRLNQFPNDYFNTIIIDEAHHCISDSYQKVLRHFPDAEVLGVTATPDRGDMQNLGTVFESLAYEYTLPKAIKEGYLSPIKAVSNLTRKLSWDGEDTATKRLLSVATQFDNTEIGFSFKVENMAVTGKYINVYKKRGNDSGVTLTVGKEISGFKIKSSIADLATAYRCTGGTPEGSENSITLDGYKYDDGDFYVEGSYVKSRKALEKWSRYPLLMMTIIYILLQDC